jgi:hypothetical protein
VEVGEKGGGVSSIATGVIIVYVVKKAGCGIDRESEEVTQGKRGRCSLPVASALVA